MQENNPPTWSTFARLAFADHMDRFVTGDRAPSCPKRAKMLACADPAFDRPAILESIKIRVLLRMAKGGTRRQSTECQGRLTRIPNPKRIQHPLFYALLYLSEQSGASANLQMTTATLEVLACIAFKQPISQAEIDLLFEADKRGLVVKLRDLKLVEEFAGADGRLRFATTAEFLQRFVHVRILILHRRQKYHHERNSSFASIIIVRALSFSTSLSISSVPPGPSPHWPFQSAMSVMFLPAMAMAL